MADETSQPKPLADADNFEEFKKLRGAQREPKAEPPAPAAEVTEEPKSPQSSDTDSEKKAPVPETEETKIPAQEEGKHKGDRSLEARIRELRAKGEHDKADKILRDAWHKQSESERAKDRDELDRIRKELQEIRTRKPEPEQPKQAAEPSKPEPIATDPNDPEPQLTDEKYQKEGGFTDFQRDLAKWTFRQEKRAVEQADRQAALKTRSDKFWSDGRAAHPADFDSVVGKVVINQGALLEGFKRLDNLGEVLYKLGNDPAEIARIAALDPPDQYAELRYLSREVAKPAAAPPTAATPPPEPQLKPAVSRAAPPPRVLSGGRDEGEQQTTAEAKDFDDFKRIRKMRRAS